MTTTFVSPSLNSVLDSAYDGLHSHAIHRAIAVLADALRDARSNLGAAEWQRYVASCLAHPVKQLLHQDPFTWRCFAKPRGYAGDAVMLDHVYSDGALAQRSSTVTSLGKTINAYTTRSRPAARAVRFRRDFVAMQIDEIADQFDRPQIVSIAAGHARELDHSDAFRQHRIGSFTAVDQDVESLAEIARHHPGRTEVHTLTASVRQILTGKVRFAGEHFVYASGLFDYLGESTATLLTEMMFDALAPGGRILVANFLQNIDDIGYMESFMAWNLNLRTPEEIIRLGGRIGSRGVSEYLTDPDDNVGFLVIRKR